MNIGLQSFLLFAVYVAISLVGLVLLSWISYMIVRTAVKNGVLLAYMRIKGIKRGRRRKIRIPATDIDRDAANA